MAVLSNPQPSSDSSLGLHFAAIGEAFERIRVATESPEGSLFEVYATGVERLRQERDEAVARCKAVCSTREMADEHARKVEAQRDEARARVAELEAERDELAEQLAAANTGAYFEACGVNECIGKCEEIWAAGPTLKEAQRPAPDNAAKLQAVFDRLATRAAAGNCSPEELSELQSLYFTLGGGR